MDASFIETKVVNLNGQVKDKKEDLDGRIIYLMEQLASFIL